MRSKYFDPWIGDQYQEGIDGNTILVVGEQHWCDPEIWKCDKDPHKCLEEHDSDCTAWKKATNGNLELCPLHEKCNYKNKKNKCLLKSIRFLHCETKISVWDHIQGKERAKRTRVFEFVFKALKSIFPKRMEEYSNKEIEDLSPKQKKWYWDRIIFTNFIQHYTKLLPGGKLGKGELKINPEKNYKGIKKCLEQHFKDKAPDVVIVLKNKDILQQIKGQLGSQYNHCKYEDSPNEYYVLANDKSNLYKRLFSNNPDINKFIEKHVKDWKAEQATTRKIETLVEFLKRNKYVKNYKEGEIKVLKLCSKEIQERYGLKQESDGKYKIKHLQRLKDIRRKDSPHPITDDEIKDIEELFFNFMTSNLVNSPG